MHCKRNRSATLGGEQGSAEEQQRLRRICMAERTAQMQQPPTRRDGCACSFRINSSTYTGVRRYARQRQQTSQAGQAYTCGRKKQTDHDSGIWKWIPLWISTDTPSSRSRNGPPTSFSWRNCRRGGEKGTAYGTDRGKAALPIPGIRQNHNDRQRMRVRCTP